MSSALPLARLMRRQDKDFSTVTLLSLNPCQASAELTWACCSPKGRGFSRAVTIRGSGHCAARLPSPGVAANRISLSCATLRTLDCGTQSITGHASLPSMIRSAEPGTQRFVDVAIRTAAPCGALRTDFLPWPVSFYSDRRCSIRTYDRQRATASCAMHRQFSFFVRLRRCFSVPTLLSSSASRAAAVKTGCVAAIAVATRSGLDGREHGARLSWVGSPPPALRQRSLFGKQSELETASPSGVTAPRAFPLDDW